MKPSRIAEFIRRMPKTDLHVHLDGSICVDTLIDLAGETGVKLPSYSLDGLHKLVFKDQYASILESGYAYKIPELRLKKREALGLPPLPKGNPESIRKSLKDVSFMKHMENKGEPDAKQ